MSEFEKLTRYRMVLDNILVEMLPESNETKSGIVLPKTRKGAPVDAVRAVVLDVGPGWNLGRDGRAAYHPINDIKDGDIVLVPRNAGDDYSLDRIKPRQVVGADFSDGPRRGRIVKYDEILGVLELSTIDDPLAQSTE